MSALRSILISIAFVMFPMVSGAQTPPGQDMPLATRSVKLTAEQHHIIKEIVLKELKVKGVEGDVKVEVGEPVGDNVNVQPFPAVVSDKVPELRSHSFFVKNDQVIIVDSRSKRVADVVK